MVFEFANVFPKELPFLSPHREMDFSIELYLGTDPISIAPYRMAPILMLQLPTSPLGFYNNNQPLRT